MLRDPESTAALDALKDSLFSGELDENISLRSMVATWAFDFVAGWRWHHNELTIEDALVDASTQWRPEHRSFIEKAFRAGFTAREKWIAGKA